jgi:predicted RNase H-like nuclease (RuvC/YqgF family)
MSEAELRAEIERLQTKVDRQGETITEQAERIEAVEAQNEQLHDEKDDLREHNRRITKDLAGAQSRITELEEVIEEQPSQPTESDESTSRDESMTPMERLMRFGEDSIVGRATESVERAMAIAENFSRWASKTPKGLVISDGLKNLVETATGERLFWKQIERACLALAKFTKGAIGFKNHPEKGWMLIAQPDDHKYQSLSAPGG